MATLAIMIGGAVLNAATFIGGNYLAKALSGDSGQAALDEKKSGMTKPLKNIKRIMRTELLDWVAAQDRLKKKLFTTFKYRQSTGPLQPNTQSKSSTSSRTQVLRLLQT